MVDLSDPIYEFVRNDPVFLMDLYEDHVNPVLPSAFEQPAALRNGPGGAPRLAATDTPATSRRADTGPHAAASRRQRSPQPGVVRRSGRK